MAPTRAAVVGGSIAGLGAAVALRRIGYDVTVHEQSPGALSSRGAGLVLQPEVELLLTTFDVVDPARIATSCRERQYLRRDGTAETSLAMPQRFTAWNALYRHLRQAVPADRLRHGQRVVGVEDEPDGATVRFADGEAETVDLVVAADGWGSSVRRALLPGVEPVYAGYVAWRGVADERDLPASVVEVLADRFTFFDTPDGGHCLCYLVPGADGELADGARRLNWVWYVQVDDGPGLRRQLTDARGAERALSVPAGSASAAFSADVRERAHAVLPAVLAELVAGTREPFVQAIIDLESPQMAWHRVCLVGDAAFVPRPHTAAATAKAAGDVLALAAALSERGPGDEPAALRAWEPGRLEQGRALAAYGRRLAPWPPGVRRAAVQ